jgi:hypothetical protein
MVVSPSEADYCQLKLLRRDTGKVLIMSLINRATTTTLLLFLFTALVVISPDGAAYAKKRSRTATVKAVGKSKPQARSARSRSGRREQVARGSRGRAARRGPQISQSQIRDLMKRSRRGRLSKSDRKLLAAYHAEQRRRAEAIRQARLRVIRARDEALRNIAGANILKDNTTGEDMEVRRAAIEALGGKAGTVVVMDATSGRIYSIVNQRMALGSPVKPCSTVKLVVGLGGLREGILDPSMDFQLASDGRGLNLTDAMARSNNPFFQEVGRRLGYEKVVGYAGNYGFGETTGANYLGESSGFLPEEGEQNTGHMSSHGDGFGFTAIQLANFTAAIANGGNLYVPRIPRTPEEAENFQPVLKRKIEMTPEDRLRLLSGMIGAVNYGTAKAAYDPIGQVAGKTGTCTGSEAKLGLFTSFSSVTNPRLVVTVITNGSGEAGKRAADIAGKIYRSISHRFLAPGAVPSTVVTEIQPKTTIDMKDQN